MHLVFQFIEVVNLLKIEKFIYLNGHGYGKQKKSTAKFENVRKLLT